MIEHFMLRCCWSKIQKLWGFFSIDRWDIFHINKLISRVFKSICFLFWRWLLSNLTCNRTVVPRHFTTSVWCMIVWFMLNARQWSFRKVNVMCDDLDWLTLIFHFCSHFSLMCTCSWRLSEAIVGSSWVANIAVSSANVPNVVSLNVGMYIQILVA